ncbi:hypothetical protein A0O34_13980 [Chryseobacterium glaciei]|uniref:Glycosyl transferase family 1 n=1 Tax=Chryseobacterium glaciei TaxID=1685010 RepID=A0A172XX69_9FLAO|nr:glycosyltransferase family 4 protein [Chryseobacterium glaciei]ANF51544.1 hypothetical protein A0O34_13980 [Chryseobacterium glaciei]
MKNKSKKIVMLQDFFGLDYTYQENLLTKNYTKYGHNVVVISSTFENVFDYAHNKYDSSKKQKTEEYFGAKIIRLPYSFNFLNKLRKHAGVYEILLKEKPDLIYVHDIHFNLKEAVKYKKQFPNCKIILDYHADYTNSAHNWVSLNILHKVIRKSFFNKYKKYISKIFPVVPGGADFLHEVYGVSHKEMELLPLGCDYSKSMEIMQNIDNIKQRQNLGIKENDIIIITGGKINKLKNTHVIVDAIKKNNREDVHLIVFGKEDQGSEEYFDNIKKSAENYKNIHFIGWVDNTKIYELLAISDLAVYPSSQSVLWQQSIGMHLPLIVGDFGGQDMSYLNQNNNIIKVDKENLNADYFATLLNQLIENPSEIEQMKKGAEKTAKEYLDYRIIAEKTLEN